MAPRRFERADAAQLLDSAGGVQQARAGVDDVRGGGAAAACARRSVHDGMKQLSRSPLRHIPKPHQHLPRPPGPFPEPGIFELE